MIQHMVHLLFLCAALIVGSQSLSDPHETRQAEMEHSRLVSRLLPGIKIHRECTDPKIICVTRAGDAATLQKLVQEGADASVRSSSGLTSLHWAVWNAGNQDNLLILKTLLTSDSGKKAVNSRGGVLRRTPLMWASEKGFAAAVDMLLPNGANVSMVDTHGDSSLRLALREHHSTIVATLISHGAKQDWDTQEEYLYQQAEHRRLFLDHAEDEEDEEEEEEEEEEEDGYLLMEHIREWADDEL